MAFDRLASEDPPALALLTLLAWLGHEPVPQDLLAEHREHLPASLGGHDLSELTATLTRRGLAHVERQSLQQHRLPAAH
ncbi:MAG: tetratricopeptide repeat protein, partial [Pseudonocardia sp.]|nr:tetratricopeptide repeat protein [Pseudonocardia sp.]